jgi:nitrogen regulatory protein PII
LLSFHETWFLSVSAKNDKIHSQITDVIYSVVKFMGNEGDAGSFTIPVQQAHKIEAATELSLRTATEN